MAVEVERSHPAFQGEMNHPRASCSRVSSQQPEREHWEPRGGMVDAEGVRTKKLLGGGDLCR